MSLEHALVVEDDAAIRGSIVRLLEREGHVVTSCADGIAGLAAALDPAVTVVLLDLDLPRMHGLEVLQRLRAARPQLPVLICTAAAIEVELVLDNRGALLSKPFRSRDLYAVLARVTGR